jgi:hypothetical protein
MAATVNITIVMGQTTYGVTESLSSADLTRLVTAYAATFGTVGDNVATGLAWANQLIGLTKQTVHAYEETQAVTAARAGVADIVITGT